VSGVLSFLREGFTFALLFEKGAGGRHLYLKNLELQKICQLSKNCGRGEIGRRITPWA
jgi:hypothetical protein